MDLTWSLRGSDEHAAGVVMRRRQRRLRSWLRHERMTVAVALAEMKHRTAPRGPKMARAGEYGHEGRVLTVQAVHKIVEITQVQFLERLLTRPLLCNDWCRGRRRCDHAATGSSSLVGASCAQNRRVSTVAGVWGCTWRTSRFLPAQGSAAFCGADHLGGARGGFQGCARAARTCKSGQYFGSIDKVVEHFCGIFALRPLGR